MNKKVVISTIVIAVIIISATFMFMNRPESRTSSDVSTKPFIVANPLDLSQIEELSKFRSCVGHDYSGKNINGETETLRSMKHYIDYKKSLSPSGVKIFAPFDGKIREASNNNPGQLVYISPDAASSWNFIFFHVKLLSELDKGSEVQAGQHIGYVTSGAINNFDIALRRFGFGGQVTDSPFYYMSDKVLAEYVTFGITLTNIVVTKEVRDSNPCPIEPGTESKYDTFFTSGDRPEDWVTLN